MSLSRQGSKNPQWKGGRIRHHGYVFVKKSEHPFANNCGYVREHRLIIEKKIGRFLHRWEIVHHINGITDDNREENLALCKNEANHQKKFHGRHTAKNA